jgi:hypothetical protein
VSSIANIDSCDEPDVITTKSNWILLEQVRKGAAKEAAILPADSVKHGDFSLVIENVVDYSND